MIKNINSITFLLISVIDSMGLSANTSFEDGEFKVGASKSKMTPPLGSIIGDSYGTRVSEGLHDDLYIKTLVFEHGIERLAFITLDVVSLPHSLRPL